MSNICLILLFDFLLFDWMANHNLRSFAWDLRYVDDEDLQSRVEDVLQAKKKDIYTADWATQQLACWKKK